MKKGIITKKMSSRFSVISWFINENHEFPTNQDISSMFNIPIGSATKRVLDIYRKNLTNCPLCGHKLNK